MIQKYLEKINSKQKKIIYFCKSTAWPRTQARSYMIRSFHMILVKFDFLKLNYIKKMAMSFLIFIGAELSIFFLLLIFSLSHPTSRQP